MSPTFQLDTFLADCRAALGDAQPQKAIQEVVARAVADAGPVLRELGEPAKAGIQPLHRSDTLTVLNVIWAPHMTLMPHNHRMWAVIGIYGGREDNIFWRRLAGEEPSRLEAAGAKALGDRDAISLGRDIIHSVTNPIPRLTGAIHVYGGDFFAEGRSEWDPGTLRERRFDMEKNLRLFEEANARWKQA